MGPSQWGCWIKSHMGVSKNRETPQNGWFIMESPIKNGWFGGENPPFKETPTWNQPKLHPLRAMDDLGGKTPYCWKHPYVFFVFKKIKSRIHQAGILRKQQEHFFGALIPRARNKRGPPRWFTKKATAFKPIQKWTDCWPGSTISTPPETNVTGLKIPAIPKGNGLVFETIHDFRCYKSQLITAPRSKVWGRGGWSRHWGTPCSIKN